MSLPYLMSGACYDICNWCGGDGRNPHDLPCERCGGFGLVELDESTDDEWDDEE